DLRSALSLKSRRYGNLNAPYLIVVGDGKGQIFGVQDARMALTEALFGDEIATWTPGVSEAKLDHARNGFWRGANGPRNAHVSGVILFPDPDIWGLRSPNKEPVLAINPWAKLSLPDLFKTLTHFEAKDDQWVLKTGTSI